MFRRGGHSLGLGLEILCGLLCCSCAQGDCFRESVPCGYLDRKYSKFPDLLIAYVWNVSEPARTQIYVLTQQETVDIATEMKYTATESWIGNGVYVVQRLAFLAEGVLSLTGGR
jgi:hypothetical protein